MGIEKFSLGFSKVHGNRHSFPIDHFHDDAFLHLDAFLQ